MPKKPTLDPRSADVVLRYTGSPDGTPAIAGIPARDLSANDLAKLVFRRTRPARQQKDKEGLVAGDEGFDDALAGVYAELAATPLYTDPGVSPPAQEG